MCSFTTYKVVYTVISHCWCGSALQLIHSSTHPLIHPSTHPPIHLSIHPSIHPSNHPTTHPPIDLTIHLSIYISTYRPIHPSTHPLIDPLIHLHNHFFTNPSVNFSCLLFLNHSFTHYIIGFLILLGVYEPPSTWKSKMKEAEMQADVVTGVTDPITGDPTNVTYPQPISEDIDLLERKPCQGGTCETYLIKDRNYTEDNSTGQGGQPCCNQMPPAQPCLALACPPPAPTPPCNPNCPPVGGGAQTCPMPSCPNNCCLRSNVLYRRGGIYFENHRHKT